MTSLAAMREALAALDPIVRDVNEGFMAMAAPHGPGAARQVAQQLADAGAHSHLVADGTVVCLSGCGQTPGQVLL